VSLVLKTSESKRAGVRLLLLPPNYYTLRVKNSTGGTLCYIHFKEEISTIRGYSYTASYKNRDKPIFSCTIHYISDTEVYLGGAIGVWGTKVFRKLATGLSLRGIKLIRYERNKELKEINITRYE